MRGKMAVEINDPMQEMPAVYCTHIVEVEGEEALAEILERASLVTWTLILKAPEEACRIKYSS